MKINIYYGGRGVIDDPTIYVIKKMEEMLAEMHVEVRRYNIFEKKNEITTLPQTFTDVDGIILATTVEWLGIGGYMTQFLDACWLYGDKEKISGIYMQPVVLSTTYGEREGSLSLENAWTLLGGIPCSGLIGYVEDIAAFESNAEYVRIIEKKVENLYRKISQKSKGLPTSSQAVKKSILRTQQLELTQQESDQLSVYASDDAFVSKQRQDIMELSSLYKNLLGESPDESGNMEFISSFKAHFNPIPDFKATYRFEIEGEPKPLFLSINGNEIECTYEDKEGEILTKMSYETMDDIVSGRKTFQRAFGMQEMKARGRVSILQKLDELFTFQN